MVTSWAGSNRSHGTASLSSGGAHVSEHRSSLEGDHLQHRQRGALVFLVFWGSAGLQDVGCGSLGAIA